LFDELPRSAALVAGQFTPLVPFILKQLPTEWLVDAAPSSLICCVCLGVVFDPPNLEACGQLCRCNTALLQGPPASVLMSIALRGDS
jgi:hypothetical protein